MPEPSETTDQPGISAAIVVCGNRVLLIHRRISEGDLVWQFPAGAIEAGESAEQAAVRETAEETGLTVSAVKPLGGRLHPQTQRLMSYTVCEPIDGEAHVADEEEVAAVAWVGLQEIPHYAPRGLFPPVQEYLDRTLAS